MNTERPRYVRLPLFQRNWFLVISVFTALAVFAMVPLFKTTASSTSKVKRSSESAGTNSPTAAGSLTELLSLPSKSGGIESFLLGPQGPTETIATYSSDCSTPQTTFQLGETVCAKTNSVDLNYPGGRWVHWLAPGNVIEYGSSTTTLITSNPQTFLHTPASAGVYKVTIAETGDDSQTPASFTVVPNPNLSIYEDGCTTASSIFTLGDPVCVQASNQPTEAGRVTRRIHLINPDGYLVDTVDVSAGSSSASHTFTLPEDPTSQFAGNPPVTVDNRGGWRINVVDTADGSIKESLPITVRDPDISVADLQVSKYYTITNTADAGGTLQAVIWIYNAGPDPAEGVTFTDITPANTNFQSLDHTFGPTFNCTVPNVGEAGTITCSRTSLAKDEASGFVVTYQVETNVGGGTEFTSTVTVDTTTADRDDTDDSASSTGTVGTAAGGGCTLTCPDNVPAIADTVEDVNGTPTSGAHVNYAAAETGGDCGTVTYSIPSGSFFPVGSTVVDVSATGGSCSFIVTVRDDVSISCPGDVITTAEANETTADVDPGTPTTTPTTGVTVTGIRSDDDDDPETPPLSTTAPYPVGVTYIEWTVRDTAGHEASCFQRIDVSAADRQNLTMTCPADKSVEAPSGSCEATVNTGTPTTNPSDNNVTINSSRSDGRPLNDPYPAGVTTITWTATDAVNGNVASCTQTITVTTSGDTTPPTFTHVPPPVTVTTNSCGQIVSESELGTAEATDTDNNCATGNVTIQRSGVPSGNFFPTGTTTITYTATDAAGNSATATQTVTVNEDPAVNPTIVAPPDPAPTYTGPGATSCGALVSDATLGSATASDNCPGVTITRTGVPAGNIFPVGSTNVTYTATDRSGNTAFDTQVVVVIDNTVPVVTPPAPVTLYTGGGSTSCSVTVSDLDGTLGTGSATDNCPGVGAVSRTGVPAGGVFPVGTTTLTYSATDAHGNSDSEQQVVTVIDNTPPVISCPANITIEPTCPTGAIATYSTPTATDNCGVQSVLRTAGLASGSVFPIGTTTVTHQATDIHNNQSSCSFTVTVLTPQQVVQNLIAAVQASNLTGQQRNGLLSKLNAALSAINNGQTNVACNKLSDFVNNVGTLVSHGDLSAATGNAWISSANHVRNTIGCTNLPCS